ncbi:MAG: hypothetical protein PHP45_01540 [Elusimicrobiales bacterium]|nr:hypothetical protein [Elusimicrobiales bacterium]
MRSAAGIFLAAALALLPPPAPRAEEFSVTTYWPQTYSSMNSVLLHPPKDNKGGFAEGGGNESGGAPASRIYIGGFDAVNTALNTANPLPSGLYGLYRPSGDLVLRASDSIELFPKNGGSILFQKSLLGRVCKWVPGLKCPANGEVWTLVAMGGTNDEGSFIDYSQPDYGAVLCCRFQSGMDVYASASSGCILPADETRVIDCPDGKTGAITQARSYTCPGPTAGAWTVVSQNCDVCVPPEPKTRTVNCPDDGVGKITQMKTYACSGQTVTESDWEDVSESCVAPTPKAPCVLPSPNPMTRTLGCCPGLTGAVTEQKQVSCVNGAPQGTWQKVSDTCALAWGCAYNSGCGSGILCGPNQFCADTCN